MTDRLTELVEKIEQQQLLIDGADVLIAELQERLRARNGDNERLKAKLKGWKDGALDVMTRDGEFFNRRHCEQQAEIEALKAEKIRAYDNGYEDGSKASRGEVK